MERSTTPAEDASSVQLVSTQLQTAAHAPAAQRILRAPGAPPELLERELKAPQLLTRLE